MENKVKFKDFVEDTTLHGIKYVFKNENTKLRKTAWIACLLLTFSTLTIQIVNIVQKYDSYEVYTSYNIRQETSLNLPSITFCNLNLISNSSYWKLLEKHNISHDILFGPPNESNSSLNGLSNITFTEFYLAVNSKIDDFFIYCTLGVLPINCTERVSFVITDTGPCYTFNSLEKIQEKGNITLNMEGQTYGVGFVINVEPEEYLSPAALGKGFRVVIHDPYEYPLKDAKGSFTVGTGQEAFLGLERQETKKLSQPYSNPCIGDKERFEKKVSKYHNLPYSEESCRMECVYKKIVDCPHCEARARDETACSFIEIPFCVQQNLHKYFQKSFCPCKPLCHTVKYKHQISYTSFPHKGVSNIAHLHNWPITDLQELQSKAAVLWVYFNKLETIVVEEHPVWDIVQLMSSFGGLIGLYLGASVVTIVEFLDFTIIKMYHLLLRNKKRDGKIKQFDM